MPKLHTRWLKLEQLIISLLQHSSLLVNGKGEPRVPRELKRRLRATIHNLKQGKSLSEGETIFQVIGYAAFVAMVEPELGKRFLSELYPLIPENLD